MSQRRPVLATSTEVARRLATSGSDRDGWAGRPPLKYAVLQPAGVASMGIQEPDRVVRLAFAATWCRSNTICG